MTFLFFAIVFLVLVVLLLALTLSAKSKSLVDAQKTAEYYIGVNKRLSDSILTLQEAQRVQKDRTDKITTGTNSERVAGSLNVLSDISKAGAARARSKY